MAGKIRGITIELGADASGVLDSLKSVNAEIKSTQSQIKDVDKLLKLDPSNTELLTQKTKLLQEQIENTKEKLQALKDAQADMDANGVDKNSDQYQALQREIIATEQELKNLESTAGSGSAALAKISTVTGEIGEKMEAAGKKMSVVSAAIVALGAAAVSAFNEVDEGSDIVIKKTGATGEAAEELEQSYKNVAKGIVADWSDIGSAVGEVNTRFKVTGEDLEDLSDQFLKFADINEMDVTSAVSGVDMAMKTFNVDQSEAQNVMGLLSKTSQDTGISMDTLLGLLQSSGATLKEMGLDLDDSVTLMGNFEAAGIDSNTMLTKMSKAATYFSQRGLDMNEGLSDLIARLQDSSTESEATAEAYEIFGSKAGLAFITAAKEGKLSISDLSTSMSDYGDVVENTYQQTLDGTDSMKLAWQNMQLGLAELGSAIGDTLAPIMEKITGVIQSVVDWFTNLDDGTKETIVTIGLLVAAIGPLLVIGGKVMSGISSITGALSAMGSSTFGPIGIAIAAVAALVAGVVALQQGLHNAYLEASPFTESLEDIKTKNAELTTSLSTTKQSYEDATAAAEAQSGVASTLYGHLQDLIAGYDGTASSQAEIEATVKSLNETVPGLGLSWDEVTNSLNKTNTEIYANIEAMRAQAEVAALQEMYTQSLKDQYAAQKNVSEAQQTMVDVLQSYGLTWADVQNYVNGGVAAEAQFSAKLMENGVALWNVNDATGEVMAAVKGYTDARINQTDAEENVTFAEEQLATAMENAAKATTAAASDIEKACTQAFGSIPTELQAAIDAAETAGVEIPQSLIDGINDGSVSVEQACEELVALTDQKKQATANATDTANAYTSTMESTISDGADEVEDAAQDVVDGMDKADEAYDYGEDAGSSFDDGLGSQQGNIQSTAEGIANDVENAMAPLPGDMSEAGDSSGSSLESGFGGWRSAISGTVDDTYNFFYSTLGTMLPPLMSQWGSDSAQKFKGGLNIWATDIQGVAENMSSSVTTAVSNLPSDLYAVGDNAGSGLYNGLAGWQSALSNLAWSIADDIRSAAQAALKIKSPSRVMQEIGMFTGEGLQEGLVRSEKGILNEVNNLASQMVNGIGSADLNAGISALNSNMNTSIRTSRMQTASSGSAMNQLVGILSQYMPYLATDKDIYFDDGTWAGKLAPAIEEQFGIKQTRMARG